MQITKLNERYNCPAHIRAVTVEGRSITIISVIQEAEAAVSQLLVGGIHTPTHMHTHVRSPEIDCHTRPSGKQCVDIFSMTVCTCLSIVVWTKFGSIRHCEDFFFSVLCAAPHASQRLLEA